jgi:hypothetical protein
VPQHLFELVGYPGEKALELKKQLEELVTLLQAGMQDETTS